MFYADHHCECREVYNPHGYVFTGKCVETGEMHSVTIPGPELFAYRQGAKIQDAMSSISPEDREFLMSGVSPKGWKNLWDTNEEDEED